MEKKLIHIFEQQFKTTPTHIFKAPGRVNLIGDHTDYNNGFVLPMAINRYIWLALKPRNDQEINVYSKNFDAFASFDTHKPEDAACRGGSRTARGGDNAWIEYIKGVAWAIQDAYPDKKLSGFDAVIYGNIATGASLSSSAALELVFAKAFTELANIKISAADIAKLAQKAENEWVGMNCGIMDQLVIAAAKEDDALLIDCQDLTTTNITLPHDAAIVIMDTNTRRGLVDSAYNERRQQCEEAAKLLGVDSLREVTDEIWESKQHLLSYEILRRASHVFQENLLVLDTIEAFKNNDLHASGEYMKRSHKSLQQNFEVSTKALDTIVEAACNSVGCFGARMTGGGFGGCAVALVKDMYADDFIAQVSEQYEHDTEIKPNIYLVKAVHGTYNLH